MEKKKWLEILIVALVIVSVCLCIDYRNEILRFLKIKPVGGEVYMPDFRKGVEIQVTEEYTATRTDFSPHSVWRVTETDLSDKILSLCGEIRQYREIHRDLDFITYLPKNVYPSIELLTDKVKYDISVIYWDDLPKNARIYQELHGAPVLCVFRRKLTDDSWKDTENSLSGLGWYSTLTPKNANELLRLLRSVGSENAVEIQRIENR